jgi:hypothetical protein
MKNKHTIEEFMCWRRENLERLADSLASNLGIDHHGNWCKAVTHERLAEYCVELCNRLDAQETPITIVAESGGRDVDTKELT